MTLTTRQIVDYLYDREHLDPLTWYYCSQRIAAGGDLMVCFTTRNAAAPDFKAFHVSQAEIRRLEKDWLSGN